MKKPVSPWFYLGIDGHWEHPVRLHQSCQLVQEIGSSSGKYKSPADLPKYTPLTADPRQTMCRGVLQEVSDDSLVTTLKSKEES